MMTSPDHAEIPDARSPAKLARWFPFAAAGSGLALRAAIKCHDYRDHRYLLWGQRDAGGDTVGWSRLIAARTHELRVPFEPAPGQPGIALIAREYFAIAEDGNVVVAAERLLGFRGVQRIAGMKDDRHG